MTKLFSCGALCDVLMAWLGYAAISRNVHMCAVVYTSSSAGLNLKMHTLVRCEQTLPRESSQPVIAVFVYSVTRVITKLSSTDPRFEICNMCAILYKNLNTPHRYSFRNVINGMSNQTYRHKCCGEDSYSQFGMHDLDAKIMYQTLLKKSMTEMQMYIECAGE